MSHEKAKIVVRDLNKTFTRIVYRVVDGKTVATPVKVGPSDLTQTVITEGISADDVLVTGPFRILVDLKHDAAVKDQDAEEEKESEGDETVAAEESTDETDQDESEEAGDDESKESP